MIHTTIGIYPDGSFKMNGVPSEHLATHLEYNLKMRPGRALVLDGRVLYFGSMSLEEIEAVLQKIYERHDIPRSEYLRIHTTDTQPYY